MPIINVKFIENVVATPEQKQELVVALTDTFVGVLGEVVRPFVYVVIDETPQMAWGIAGKPMPDLAWLTGPEYKEIMERSQDIMREVIRQASASNGAADANGAAEASGTKAPEPVAGPS